MSKPACPCRAGRPAGEAAGCSPPPDASLSIVQRAAGKYINGEEKRSKNWEGEKSGRKASGDLVCREER